MIADRQMPSFHDVPQGDMYIEYSVVLPVEVSAAARSKLLDVFGETSGSYRHTDEL